MFAVSCAPAPSLVPPSFCRAHPLSLFVNNYITDVILRQSIPHKFNFNFMNNLYKLHKKFIRTKKHLIPAYYKDQMHR